MAQHPNTSSFIDRFSPLAIRYDDKPFELRGGGESNWYVDCVAGLSQGSLLAEAADLLIYAALVESSQVVAAAGIPGRALATAIQVGADMPKTEINDTPSPGERYGYGLHGAKVEGKIVWLVDGVANSGDSLLTSLRMITDAGGEVERADVLVDRSQGQLAVILGELGVSFSSVLTFVEQDGILAPSC